MIRDLQHQVKDLGNNNLAAPDRLTVGTGGIINNGPTNLKAGSTVAGGETVTGGLSTDTFTATGTSTLAGVNAGATSVSTLTASAAVTANAGVSTTTLSTSGNATVGGTTTSTGDMFTPNASAAVSGYTICYLNSDGRVSKGSSSARYKVDIAPVDPASLGDLFPDLQTYAMREDPNRTQRIGYIAEHLAANADQERFVVWQFDGDELAVNDQGEHIPESIDFIGLLLAQVAQLDQRLKAAGL